MKKTGLWRMAYGIWKTGICRKAKECEGVSPSKEMTEEEKMLPENICRTIGRRRVRQIFLIPEEQAASGSSEAKVVQSS